MAAVRTIAEDQGGLEYMPELGAVREDATVGVHPVVGAAADVLVRVVPTAAHGCVGMGQGLSWAASGDNRNGLSANINGLRSAAGPYLKPPLIEMAG